VGVVLVNHDSQNWLDTWSVAPPVILVDHGLATGAGNNRLVLVAVGWSHDAGPSLVTYGTLTAPLTTLTTPAAFDTDNNSPDNAWVGIYAFRDNQLPPSPGAGRVTVTFPLGAGGASVDVLELRNAHQGTLASTTLGTSECASSRSLDVAVAQQGSFIYAASAVRGVNGSAGYGAVPAGYTESLFWGGWNHVGLVGFVGPVSAATTVGWSLEGGWSWCNRWAALAVVVRPATN
jgi:hypothetical protein